MTQSSERNAAQGTPQDTPDTNQTIEGLIRSWNGEVLTRYDAQTKSWMFACIHSRRLGPAVGGTRMKIYESPSHALLDGQRLAEGMTVKMAVSGFPFGGGKAVIAVPTIPEGEERTGLLRRYSEFINALGGTFWTGCDMNISSSDVDVIGEGCAYVFGRSPTAGGTGAPGPFTAKGVFYGILAALETAFGSPTLEGKSVLIQGIGSVGEALAELLSAEGAHLILSDVDQERAKTVAERLNAEVVAPELALETRCDVYAPCATGATLSAETIPRLGCRIVAGCANNQLADPADADQLRDQGILYAPDFVINAGGVFYNVGVEALHWSHDQVEVGLEGIGNTLKDIFARSAAEGISTHKAALALAESRLEL